MSVGSLWLLLPLPEGKSHREALHIGPDHEGDHRVSLLPAEFKEMEQGIREVEQALGSNAQRRVTQGEMMNREILAKSLIIDCDWPKGEIIREEMIKVKSPGKGLQPYKLKEFGYDSGPRL